MPFPVTVKTSTVERGMTEPWPGCRIKPFWRDRADLVGKRLTEESFWTKMADERPSLFARVAQLVRDLLDRVTAAFRADPLPAAWVKDFDAIRGISTP